MPNSGRLEDDTFVSWCIWYETDGSCFDNRERLVGGIKDFFYHTLLLWIRMIVTDGTSLNNSCAVFHLWLVIRCSSLVNFLYTLAMHNYMV